MNRPRPATIIALFLSLFSVVFFIPNKAFTSELSFPSSDSNVRSFLDKEGIHSISDYAIWLSKNFHYKSDNGKDTWAKPIETLQKKSGDCEDLAFLHAAVLRVFGYRPRVLAFLRGPKKAHAFCVFERNNRYEVFDNTILIKTSATSLYDFAEFAFIPRFKSSVIFYSRRTGYYPSEFCGAPCPHGHGSTYYGSSSRPGRNPAKDKPFIHVLDGNGLSWQRGNLKN